MKESEFLDLKIVQLSSVECMDITGGDTNGLMHGNTGSNNGFIYVYQALVTALSFIG